MKLDRDCLRDVLLTIEEEVGFLETSSIQVLAECPRLTKYNKSDVYYCIKKLTEADFITEISYLGGSDVSELTFKGHEFLDTIRDGEVWDKTKAVATKVGGTSLAIMAEVATSFIKTKLGFNV
ncbi:DUF2513 domain-containing protein [Bacillus halotolerans]|uniref:DUF2513 domain-containing protein n=1 Tax=Bacillus halotolerans TaxID=260554 RepID=UPI002DBDB3D1|nr:DUF2513 domain-containing protein [Bacillus halotolerans]MEC1648200.1 DUF2513 domain-containing protein [Bacillus halotolerans]